MLNHFFCLNCSTTTSYCAWNEKYARYVRSQTLRYAWNSLMVWNYPTAIWEYQQTTLKSNKMEDDARTPFNQASNRKEPHSIVTKGKQSYFYLRNEALRNIESEISVCVSLSSPYYRLHLRRRWEFYLLVSLWALSLYQQNLCIFYIEQDGHYLQVMILR